MAHSCWLHKLQLKPNMPIMLLRNLDPHAGLCNLLTHLLN